MPKAKRIVLLSALALTSLACDEDVAAPGACPDFCPSSDITLIDSVFRGSIVRDSAFRGYVLPEEAATLQAVSTPGLESRLLLLYPELPDTIELDSLGTILGAVIGTDSVTFTLEIFGRNESLGGLELVLYQLPADVDSTLDFEGLDPLFTDSNLIDTVQVSDTLTTGTFSVTLAADLFPRDPGEERLALGIEVPGPGDQWATIGARDGGLPGSVARTVRADSAGESVARKQPALPVTFDTFVSVGSPTTPVNQLVVGGAPSARSLIRVSLPARVLDSSDVVRATLILVPTGPVSGAPGDSLRVRANTLAADFGPKSPIVATPVDSVLARQTSTVAVGSTDTVEVDVTTIVRFWGADPNAPRSMMLQAIPEGGGAAEIRFGSSRSAGFEPALQVTFVPLVRFRS